LPPFTGNPLVRFESWLESFESVIARSDFSEDDVILELRGKLTDKAHKVIKYIIDNNPNEYDTIREKILDHFHGDETVEKYMKKYKKAHRKPGEKIYDYAIRLQEIFKHAYPDSHAEDSFKVILKEKFIEGLDEKLQFKVKYKDYNTFDDLVAAARKYLARMEAVENTREKQEFVNAINHTSESHTMREMKQLIEKKNETVSAITVAVKTLLRREEKPSTSQSQHHPQKAVSFHPQHHTPHSTNYTQRPYYRQNQPFGNMAAGQHYTPRAPPPQHFHPHYPSTPPHKFCDYCCRHGHVKEECRKMQRDTLDGALPQSAIHAEKLAINLFNVLRKPCQLFPIYRAQRSNGHRETNKYQLRLRVS
jgi:hypothetical protein